MYCQRANRGIIWIITTLLSFITCFCSIFFDAITIHVLNCVNNHITVLFVLFIICVFLCIIIKVHYKTFFSLNIKLIRWSKRSANYLCSTLLLLAIGFSTLMNWILWNLGRFLLFSILRLLICF